MEQSGRENASDVRRSRPIVQVAKNEDVVGGNVEGDGAAVGVQALEQGAGLDVALEKPSGVWSKVAGKKGEGAIMEADPGQEAALVGDAAAKGAAGEGVALGRGKGGWWRGVGACEEQEAHVHQMRLRKDAV